MTFEVKGMAELEKALSEMGSRAGKKVLLGALRDAAKPIRKMQRTLAPKQTGFLRKNIKIKAVAGKGATSSVATVMVGIFRQGRSEDDFYAHFQEFGTAAHDIPSPTTGRGKNKTKNKAVVAFGGKVFGRVRHPGQKAKPFMSPAFERTHKQATEILAKRLKQRIILEAIKKSGRNIN
jgi:HK97 gp10 family phage protein